MADDNDNKPPPLKVVSDNPNARTDRQATWAKQEAQHALSQFAATLLRTMAGSSSEASYLMERLSDFIEAQRKLNALSGDWLRIDDLREAFQLPETELDASGG